MVRPAPGEANARKSLEGRDFKLLVDSIFPSKSIPAYQKPPIGLSIMFEQLSFSLELLGGVKAGQWQWEKR